MPSSGDEYKSGWAPFSGSSSEKQPFDAHLDVGADVARELNVLVGPTDSPRDASRPQIFVFSTQRDGNAEVHMRLEKAPGERKPLEVKIPWDPKDYLSRRLVARAASDMAERAAGSTRPIASPTISDLARALRNLQKREQAHGKKVDLQIDEPMTVEGRPEPIVQALEYLIDAWNEGGLESSIQTRFDPHSRVLPVRLSVAGSTGKLPKAVAERVRELAPQAKLVGEGPGRAALFVERVLQGR